MAARSKSFQNSLKAACRFLQQTTSPKHTLLKELPVLTHNTLRWSSTSSLHLQTQSLPKMINNEVTDIKEVRKEERTVNLTFEDNTKGVFPFLWLRDNCQCPSCFDKVALGRNFLMQNLNTDTQPTEVCHDDANLRVTWNDGHTSVYDALWLHQRGFNTQARQHYRNLHRLQREPWGKDLILDQFDYEDLKTKDNALLKWLLTMEVKGVSLVKNAPTRIQMRDPNSLSASPTRRSPVIVRENSNNVAFTNIKLGLHNDLTQYFHQSGMIFIHTVKQHRGKGGESTVSDGLLATEILRNRYPAAFQILSQTGVYFWDKGSANFTDMETDEFYKINKAPIIGLNSEGELETLRVNNQVRDSHLDLDPKQVNFFYESLKLLDDTLYENSYNFKMEDGDILTLDNVRCLHGREGFESQSSRHLESSYLDWDEALCRRRRLLEKLGHI